MCVCGEDEGVGNCGAIPIFLARLMRMVLGNPGAAHTDFVQHACCI